jgi:hypothetical protein
MVELGYEIFLVVVSRKETNKHIGRLCKGFMIKQNIQPRIMSLILFNHSKSNVLRSKIQNWITWKDSKNLESGCPSGSVANMASYAICSEFDFGDSWQHDHWD